MSSYTISEEYLSEEKANELIELARLHNDEVGGFEDMEFTLNPLVYQSLQEAGILRVFIARDNITECAIGYIVYTVTPHPQFEGITIAKEDALFVERSHRGSMLGLKLIKHGDKVLEDKYNVSALFQTATERFDHSSILKRLGYSKVETTYIRRLK